MRKGNGNTFELIQDIWIDVVSEFVRSAVKKRHLVSLSMSQPPDCPPHPRFLRDGTGG